MTGYTVPDRLRFPDDYNSPADVPADIEALAQDTQAVLTTHAQNVQMVAPIGSIVMWPQASAPAGWHLCNGTAHGSDALTALLGSPNTPNLVNRFIVAAGGAYGVGATGGADSVTLTTDTIPPHNHQLPGYAPNLNGVAGTPYVFGQTSDAVYGFATSGTGSLNGLPHENRPPYYSLTFIIRKS